MANNGATETPSLELVEAVMKALDVHKAAFEGRKKRSRYRSPAFEFTRQLKNHPELKDLSADDAADQVEMALREIVRDRDRDLPWQAALGTSDSKGSQVDPEFDFIKVWETCDGAGTDLLEEAVRLADESPREPDYFGIKYASKRYEPFRRFLTVTDNLQWLRDEQNIVLPIKKLGVLMGKDHQQISDWRTMAVRYGFLTLKKEYQQNKLAAEYRYQNPAENQTSRTVAPEHQIARAPDNQISRLPRNRSSKPVSVSPRVSDQGLKNINPSGHSNLITGDNSETV